MSDAEAALLEVGILCNAMQIMTFAKDSIHIYRNIRDGRAPDPKLDSYLKSPLSHTQQQILDIGKKVYDCVDELQQQFSKLHVDEGSNIGLSGKMAASKKSAIALWRGKELQDAEKNLQRHEQLLHSLLLDRVCSRSQAAEITSLESFQHLQGALQNIISQLVDGSIKVSELFADFSTVIGNRVAHGHATTRAVVEDRVNSVENKMCQHMSQSIDQLRQELRDREQDKAFGKQYEQLLSSLRFPEMNSRKNKILNMTIGLSEVIQDSDAKVTHDPSFYGFVDWLESNSNVFWVSGKPASGKSFLMKFLAFSPLTVEHLTVWRGAFRLRVHELNARDISLFVRERLHTYGLECRDRDTLVYEIVEKAEGVFLWVTLVVGRLNQAICQGQATMKMLKQLIEQTPSDLTTLYSDMWGRIGDGAQLRSIRRTASLYFNLVITAREVEDDLSKDGLHYTPHAASMSSLLVLATAAQDKSMEAMLSTGRVITIQELLARCSRAENELQ
ncbi:hypothetical protein FACUT_9581 [Fusarium acutatum]|uniref:Nephrocystin 3-like N-terminal domain-containing protein n=1 Tax=Fusarium acutatum TaxID=78861 RepID=A0A8H4JHS9_9HYPO|nr:hypothetical protein FACUT_9581 [Fusarium acutatum]